MSTPQLSTRRIALAVLPLLALGACATTTTTTRTWSSQPDWVRYGRVEQVSETVTRQQGNPVAGAAVGAMVGGLLGSAIGGHSHYDRWGRYSHHGSGAGALVGALGGAAVGAAASQGSGEQRSYMVTVRFDDGAVQSYAYRDFSPFRVGDTVALSPRGIQRVRRAVAPAPSPEQAPPAAPPPAQPQGAAPSAPGAGAEAKSYPPPTDGPTLPPPADPYGEYGPPPAPFAD